MPSEFYFIFNHFAKLGANPQNFLNDGCEILTPENKKLVVTKDILISGVHFFSNDSPNSIAQKSIRKNLSDIASMGASPYGYLLGISLSKNTDENFVSDFCNGLDEMQKQYDIRLLGGDTNANKTNSIIISITMFGFADKNSHLMPRNNAKIGDSIYLSGEIGNGYIGYLVRTKNQFISSLKNESFFLNFFLNGNCRNDIGIKIVNFANSCIDISDGILQDLRHICINSKVSAKINSEKIPVNQNVSELIVKNTIRFDELLRWGDDYELLFTGHAELLDKIDGIQKIGEIIDCDENPEIYLDGQIMSDWHGFEH